jgi:hypothetical protein
LAGFAAAFLLIVTLGVGEMDYEVDLDLNHSVIRLTVTAETVTLELAEEVYQRLSEFTSRGGPFAAIYDLSAAKRTTIRTDMVRSFAAVVRPSQWEERTWLWEKSQLYMDWLVYSRCVGSS